MLFNVNYSDLPNSYDFAGKTKPPNPQDMAIFIVFMTTICFIIFYPQENKISDPSKFNNNLNNNNQQPDPTSNINDQQLKSKLDKVIKQKSTVQSILTITPVNPLPDATRYEEGKFIVNLPVLYMQIEILTEPTTDDEKCVFKFYKDMLVICNVNNPKLDIWKSQHFIVREFNNEIVKIYDDIDD